MGASLRLSVGLLVLAACSKGASPEKVVSNKPAVIPVKKPPVAPAHTGLYAWPVTPFTKQQIAEVNGCDTEKLAGQRYPKKVDVAGLPASFAAKTGCDDATLAAACADRLGQADPTPACLDAFEQAVKQNPAFAFSGGIMGFYFGKVQLVDPLPISTHKVTKLDVHYAWGGEGTPVDWTLTIDGPSVDVVGATAKKKVDVAVQVAAFGKSLDSFMPIPAPVEAVDCFDNYPEWNVKITFDDKSTLELSTHKSNIIGIGGPWQMTLDGVSYMQLGTALPHAASDMVKALELPLGEPMGMTCRGFDMQHAVLK